MKQIGQTTLFADFFLAGFVAQGILNMDSTVWVDGAILADNFISPSLMMQLTHPQNCTCKYLKIAKFDKITFYNKKNP
jgi:hypothetical protein